MTSRLLWKVIFCQLANSWDLREQNGKWLRVIGWCKLQLGKSPVVYLPDKKSNFKKVGLGVQLPWRKGRVSFGSKNKKKEKRSRKEIQMQISWIEILTTLEQGQNLFVKQGSPVEAKEAPVWNIMSVLLFLFKFEIVFSFIENLKSIWTKWQTAISFNRDLGRKVWRKKCGIFFLETPQQSSIEFSQRTFL